MDKLNLAMTTLVEYRRQLVQDSQPVRETLHENHYTRDGAIRGGLLVDAAGLRIEPQGHCTDDDGAVRHFQYVAES